MKYSRVYIDAIAYELPPEVVTSAELEERLAEARARRRRVLAAEEDEEPVA